MYDVIPVYIDMNSIGNSREVEYIRGVIDRHRPQQTDTSDEGLRKRLTTSGSNNTSSSNAMKTALSSSVNDNNDKKDSKGKGNKTTMTANMSMYSKAVYIVKHLLSNEPEDESIDYNLIMAYSVVFTIVVVGIAFAVKVYVEMYMS